MPYIKKQQREKFENPIQEISDLITCDGDLNYVITLLVHKEIYKRDLKYQSLNNLIGALECAKLELYRMVVGPYENEKVKENGCVTSLDK